MSKRISASYGKTVSMGVGSYEFARFDCSIAVDIDDATDYIVALNGLMAECNDFIEAEVEALRENL